ncbi:FtsX-like permease family protein [Chlorobaculum thiosulfatiphilum]|uniref:FtsX-like permease family protein n=1 Tax=Chlorobaculum thiosulfatiphilum TaxID=115852 RepID=A0A5C4S1Y3_CHLTI|nr:ABC transporter permease [Chlorobaculum thiosulfatiphilum]TNJ37122.1 FtsX-like permease family protein [Chlorobaculum thiosulfatiphilum]
MTLSIRETVMQAATSLAVNKLRSALTTLGVAVGVFSIIAVMTALDAVDRSIATGLSSLGANTFQIQKNPATVFGGGHNRNLYANRKDITWQEAQLFKKYMEERARNIGFIITSQAAQASYGNEITNPDVTLTGGDESFAPANGLDVIAGRNLNDGDLRYASDTAILGSDVAAYLFQQGQNPVGKQIRVNGKVYTVIGVFSKKGAAFGQSQDNFVLIPITRYLDEVNETSSISITVEATSQKSYRQTIDRAIGAMRLARGLTVKKANDFEIRTNESLVESFRDIQNIVGTGAFIISFMALLTAGVGIMNIMLVSVTERTREIGVRMSVGAPRRTILEQFLVEALLLSLGGGALGIVAGAGAGNLVALQFNLPVILPWVWIVVSLLVCSVIGISFGLFPAWKASRLDPVTALRAAR